MGEVAGAPIYAADFSLPGMLHGRIVRSPWPSARIVRIDVEAARVLSIVMCSRTDVPRNEMRMSFLGAGGGDGGAVLAFQPRLASDRVCFHGGVVAIARNAENAAQAAGWW